MNQFSALSHFLPRQAFNDHQRIRFSPCPALSHNVSRAELARCFRSGRGYQLNYDDQPAQACTAEFEYHDAGECGRMDESLDRDVAEDTGDIGAK